MKLSLNFYSLREKRLEFLLAFSRKSKPLKFCRRESQELFKRPFKIVGSVKRLSTELEEDLNGKEVFKSLKYD